MCFSTNQMTGASTEIALADEPRFQSIRLFTAKPTHDSQGPHADLSVLQNWSVATASTVGGGHANKSFSFFSAACWVQGRHLFDRLGGEVPLGLLTSAVGGTRIHAWSSADALRSCPQYEPANKTSPSNSDLWNTMVAPLLPMRFKFMVWLQSESDVCASDSECQPQRGGLYYSCAIKAMVEDWRKKFKLALPFLWVQISPWEGHEAATTVHQLPDMRLAQMAANELPLSGMATAVDLGPPANANGWDSGDEHGPDPWGNVHFRNKGPLGPRLSSAALNIVYGNATEPYRGPEAASASSVLLAAGAGAVGAVGAVDAVGTVGAVGAGCGTALMELRVSFKSETLGGGLKWVPRECPYLVLKNEAHLTTELDCPKSIDDCIAKCAWFDLEMGKGNWHLNVTATLGADGSSVVLSPPTDENGCPLVDAAPTGARYLYGDWPVATLYNEDGFPALPFKIEVG
jgi:sialate O-acetylesterase